MATLPYSSKDAVEPTPSARTASSLPVFTQPAKWRLRMSGQETTKMTIAATLTGPPTEVTLSSAWVEITDVQLNGCRIRATTSSGFFFAVSATEPTVGEPWFEKDGALEFSAGSVKSKLWLKAISGSAKVVVTK